MSQHYYGKAIGYRVPTHSHTRAHAKQHCICMGKDLVYDTYVLEHNWQCAALDDLRGTNIRRSKLQARARDPRQRITSHAFAGYLQDACI
jgi:hypothetical protein